MNQLDLTATKMKYTAAVPSVPGSKATWAAERSFRTNHREISAQENVRAGRVASGKGKRFFYYAARVSFAYGDRVLFDGLTYEIMYIPDQSHSVAINYVDTKAVQ